MPTNRYTINLLIYQLLKLVNEAMMYTVTLKANSLQHDTLNLIQMALPCL